MSTGPNKQTKNLQQSLLSPEKGPGMGKPSKIENFDKCFTPAQHHGKKLWPHPNHTGKDWVGSLDFYPARLPPPARMVSEKIM